MKGKKGSNILCPYNLPLKNYKESIEYWYDGVILGQNINSRDILNALKGDIPRLFNAIMERTCNLQCAHCIFQKEKSSEDCSKKNNLKKILLNFTEKIQGKEIYFLHEGRIVLPWHIEILKEMKKIRPSLKVGLIDNGSYVFNLNKFKEQNLKLDWLDISCDGIRKNHNKQRDPLFKKSYDVMFDGLIYARDITKPKNKGGRVTSLFTMTKINHKDLFKVAQILFKTNKLTKLSYIDEFHITTMSPHIDANFPLEIGVKEMKGAFQDIKRLHRISSYKDKVFFRFYGHKHLKLLAKAVGERKLWKSFTENILMGNGGIRFVLEGVPILYFPTSIWPQEGIFIDADGSQRHAYCQKYTLEELESKNIYTVQHLKGNESFNTTYRKGVQSWWKNFGEDFLQKEIKFFSSLNK